MSVDAAAHGGPSSPGFTFHPLTPDRWADLERLFGPRGACGGCWCMWWRLPRSVYHRQKGEANREAFHAIVASGRVPGLLAYAGEEPVGWCAVEPRSAYPALERAPTLRPVDDQPVWSVTCFYVARAWRRKGVTRALLRAAVEHVRAHGGRIVEGYPVRPKPHGAGSTAFAWTGFLPAFEQAGFREAAHRRAGRAYMRYHIPE